MGQDSQGTNSYENIKVALVKLFGKTKKQATLQTNQTGELKRKIQIVKARDIEGYERSLLFVPRTILTTQGDVWKKTDEHPEVVQQTAEITNNI